MTLQDLHRQGGGSDGDPGLGDAAGERGALRPHRQHSGHPPHQARHTVQRGNSQSELRMRLTDQSELI